jgi:epoxyqueuosine reductase
MASGISRKPMTTLDFNQLANDIKTWGRELGFADVGICDVDLSAYRGDLEAFLKKNFHGEMDYLARAPEKRLDATQLLPGALRIIAVRMNYLPPNTHLVKQLKNGRKAYISRYAVGGDYHKFMRKRLAKLAQKINETVAGYGYRAITDSAPLMEKPIAEKAGLGWIGKNTLLLNKQAGSWFFLGELLTTLPLPIDTPINNDGCQNCQACLKICPTGALVNAKQIDARRCISYLTIEHKTEIPVELRPLMGNRIYGCDDCQLICPWNRYAPATMEQQFFARQDLDSANLIELFSWDETIFLAKTEGSAIRRLGHSRWLRNIAVAMGNAPYDENIFAALQQRAEIEDALVKEHVLWALTQQQQKKEDLPQVDEKLRKISEKLNLHY